MADDQLLDVLGEVPPDGDGTAPIDGTQLARAQKAKTAISRAEANKQRAVSRLADSVEKLTDVTATPASGGTAISAATSKVLPEKEAIRIYRREQDGKLSLINDYALHEINVDGDIVGFVNKRLRPNFGDYDYVVHVIGRDGQARPHSTVPRRDSRQDRPAEEGPASLVKAIMEAIKSGQVQPAAPVQSTSDKAMEKLTDMITSSQKLDPAMLMMLPMLREAMKPSQPERPNDAVLGVVSQIAERLEKLERRRDEPPQIQFPTLPPVPVVEEPRIDVAEIIKTIASASAPRQDALGIRDVLDLVQRLQPPPPKEGMSLRDVFGLLPSIMPTINALTGRDVLQQQLMDLRQEMRDRRQTGDTSIDEEMNKLIRARNVALQLLGDQRGGGSDWKDAVLHIWDTIPNHLEAARAFAKELSSGKKSSITAGKRAPDSGSKEPKRSEESEELVVSEKAKEALDALADAEDDDVLVKAFEFLQVASASNDRWKKYAGLLVTLAREKNEERVMSVIKAIFKGLVDGDLLNADKANRVYSVLGNNVSDLVEALAG